MIEYLTTVGSAIENYDLEQYGAAGWEYCGTSPNLQSNGRTYPLLFIFKRQVDPKYVAAVRADCGRLGEDPRHEGVIFVTAEELEALKENRFIGLAYRENCYEYENARHENVVNYLAALRS